MHRLPLFFPLVASAVDGLVHLTAHKESREVTVCGKQFEMSDWEGDNGDCDKNIFFSPLLFLCKKRASSVWEKAKS